MQNIARTGLGAWLPRLVAVAAIAFAAAVQPVPASATSLDDMVETLNANVEKINRLLFTYLDYAAVGVRA